MEERNYIYDADDVLLFIGALFDKYYDANETEIIIDRKIIRKDK